MKNSVKNQKIRLGVMCCYGIDGHGCGDCPYYKAQGLEEMTCDFELADDVLALIGAQAAERSDAGE